MTTPSSTRAASTSASSSDPTRASRARSRTASLPRRLAVFFLSAAVVAGCAAVEFFESGFARANRLAAEQRWQARAFDAAPFILYGLVKPVVAAPVVAVYIEGDGIAWRDRFSPPADPTPHDPIALRLALRDPAPAVVYLARPCQYVAHLAPPATRHCDPRYWTTARFAPDVVVAVDDAIGQAKREAGAARVRLVGYSGGGVVAALIAERRDDVELLITVAAPLDVAGWTKHHGVSPLTGSLSPDRRNARVQAVRQIHFVGADDGIVPINIVHPFAAGAGTATYPTLIVVPGFDHVCCWAERWPEMLKQATARP